MDREAMIAKMAALSDRDAGIVERMLNTLEAMKQNGYPFLGNFLGVVEDADAGDEHTFVCSMPIRREFYNPYRIVYGGITATLADMGMAWMLEKRVSDSDKFVTLDLQVRYHNPGTGSKLVAVSRITHQAQDVIQMSCDVTNDKGDLVVTSTGSFLRLRRGRA